jgi:hypothetical protein
LIKKLLGILVLGLLWCNVSYAWKITSWKVVKVIEEGIYLDSNSVIGQIQYFGSGGKGKNEGIFYNCPFGGGQVTGGHTYTEEEFFKNKEFDLFKKLFFSICMSTSNLSSSKWTIIENAFVFSFATTSKILDLPNNAI